LFVREYFTRGSFFPSSSSRLRRRNYVAEGHSQGFAVVIVIIRVTSLVIHTLYGQTVWKGRIRVQRAQRVHARPQKRLRQAVRVQLFHQTNDRPLRVREQGREGRRGVT
jgi:hypothetical protein